MFMDKMAPGILRLSVMDNDIDLFEGQYPLPDGVSYNSYLIEDEQLCLLDTVDARKQDEWLGAGRAQTGLSGDFAYGAGSCRVNRGALRVSTAGEAGR